ncbi:MAG: hypothetical protein E7457_03825 [Ruminococcaceae bacterium]|nr:hypothetical protein [Oscillospiraceae bacterium]
MTLQQLAPQYRQSARLIAQRIAQLKQQSKITTDPEQLLELQTRIRALRPLQLQTNQLAELMEHYYERGYRRDAAYTI